jgi:hypothetical protein
VKSAPEGRAPGANDPQIEALRSKLPPASRAILDEALAVARAAGLVPVVPGDVPRGKSICQCSHRGDGSAAEHAGLLGHGHCTAAGCGCEKFSWRRFIWDREEVADG